jgi:nucleoside-diphosphate-sugar epimerase
MERVFLTGATGVIGRQVLPALLRLGHRVTAVGRSPEKRERLAALGADAIELDPYDADAVRRAVGGHSVVINLATHMPSSTFAMMLPWAWRENDRVRRDASAILAGAAIAAGVRRFVQESFAPVYEDGGDRWIDERWPVRPVSYNRTVLDAERSAQRVTDSGAMGIVLRFAWFYGRDRILRDMANVVRRGWSPIPGEPTAYWSSISHDDAAAAVVASLGAPAGSYNVCDDEPLTRAEFTGVIAGGIGARPPRPMPAWLTKLGGSTMELLSRSLRMSNAKLKSVVEWTLEYPSANEGVAAALNGPSATRPRS